MGRGGSRYGAGRPGHRGKVEACMRLDVREWARQGTLQPGYSGTWSWSNTHTGQRSGSIGFRVEQYEAVLSYALDGDAKTQRVPILRTLVTSVAYVSALLRAVPRVDTVHVFSASYWSFLIAPVPALVIGRLFGKRVLLNYHSGEADDHLTRWGWHAKPLLRLADAIIVPTQYLVDVFRRHGFASAAIANHIDVSEMIVHQRQPMGRDGAAFHRRHQAGQG